MPVLIFWVSQKRVFGYLCPMVLGSVKDKITKEYLRQSQKKTDTGCVFLMMNI